MIMAEQNYQPYRTELLSRDELAQLSKLNYRLVFCNIASLWLQIAAAWTVAAAYPAWWVLVVAAAFVGNRYYALFIIGHDGLHRRLHASREINDLINDVLVLGPLGAITRINRSNHMLHHRTLGCPEDPDAYKYGPRWNAGTLDFVLLLTGIPFVFRAFKNVYAGRSNAAAAKESYSGRDIVIIVGWQLALVSMLSWAFGWWGYFLMWLAPVYVFTFAADITRVFCEHSADDNPHALHARLVTFTANKTELALFAPMNMNHHVAHHLWPSIPYANLPRATELIRLRAAQLHGAAVPTYRHSYVRYLMACLGRTCERERQT
jgi:fatty acid desaturase